MSSLKEFDYRSSISPRASPVNQLQPTASPFLSKYVALLTKGKCSVSDMKCQYLTSISNWTLA